MPFDVATTLPKLDWIKFLAESASLLGVKIIKLEVLTCTGLGAFARWTFKECSHSVNDFRGCPEIFINSVRLIADYRGQYGDLRIPARITIKFKRFCCDPVRSGSDMPTTILPKEPYSSKCVTIML